MIRPEILEKSTQSRCTMAQSIPYTCPPVKKLTYPIKEKGESFIYTYQRILHLIIKVR